MDTSSTDSSFDSVLDSSTDSSFDSVLDSSADSLPDSALEAVLFASGSPVSTEKLCEIFDVQKSELSLTAELLSARLGADESGISLVYIDDSYQLCTKPSYAEFVKRALDLRKTPPLTKASLEVLAIVAYNQPATRSFIETVRGIDSASIVSSLCDKGLIFESGHLDAPGRPSVFSTTANFLRCFGLEKISDLPDVLDSAQFLEKSIDEESIDEKSINDESINEESSKNTPSDGDTAL